MIQIVVGVIFRPDQASFLAENWELSVLTSIFIFSSEVFIDHPLIAFKG